MDILFPCLSINQIPSAIVFEAIEIIQAEKAIIGANLNYDRKFY